MLKRKHPQSEEVRHGARIPKPTKGPRGQCLVSQLGLPGIILPSCKRIIISHDEDSYQQTSIMECHKGWDHCSSHDVGWDFSTSIGAGEGHVPIF